MKKHLKVRPSQIHGKGLFTTVAIKRGTLIGYCKTAKTVEPGWHTLSLESGDVDVTCKFKYINHHKKPNVAYYDDLSVMALRNLAIGDELLHDYGDDWD